MAMELYYTEFRKLFKSDTQAGYSMMTAMLALALTAIIVGAVIMRTIGSSKTTASTQQRSINYYAAENAIGKTIAWLRDNSNSMAQLMDPSSLETTFDRGAPSVGENDSDSLSIPTQLKLKDTHNSAILTSDSTLGSGAFPDVTDSSGNTFNTSAEFADQVFKNAKIRVTLIDAVQMTVAPSSTNGNESGSGGSGGSDECSGGDHEDDHGGCSDGEEDDHSEVEDHDDGSEDDDHSEVEDHDDGSGDDHGESEHEDE